MAPLSAITASQQHRDTQTLHFLTSALHFLRTLGVTAGVRPPFSCNVWRSRGVIKVRKTTVAQLVLYAVLIIVTMAVLEWREWRRPRSSRERLHTRCQGSILERPPAYEKKTA